LKGVIALAIALGLCFAYQFDILAVLFAQPKRDLGIVVTGLVVAGGSAGAIAIFQGFLNMSKETRDAMIAARKANAEAAKQKAEATVMRAQTEAAQAQVEKIAAQAQAQAAFAQFGQQLNPSAPACGST
jgi:mannitol-specific phosphotransferase system IIBC component